MRFPVLFFSDLFSNKRLSMGRLIQNAILLLGYLDLFAKRVETRSIAYGFKIEIEKN
jgi:hypothetical protein